MLLITLTLLLSSGAGALVLLLVVLTEDESCHVDSCGDGEPHDQPQCDDVW